MRIDIFVSEPEFNEFRQRLRVHNARTGRSLDLNQVLELLEMVVDSSACINDTEDQYTSNLIWQTDVDGYRLRVIGVGA